MTEPKPRAIIGIGNFLLGDEGVGIHAINYLKQFDWPEDVELIDAGVPGPSLLYMIEDRRLSIIIDCADFRGKPGDVLVVPHEKIKKPEENLASLHDTSLTGVLALAKEADINIQNTVIICVQPKHIGMSNDLSEDASHAMPKIKEAILKLL